MLFSQQRRVIASEVSKMVLASHSTLKYSLLPTMLLNNDTKSNQYINMENFQNSVTILVILSRSNSQRLTGRVLEKSKTVVFGTNLSSVISDRIGQLLAGPDTSC